MIRAALERGLSGLEADAARPAGTSDLAGIAAELAALRVRLDIALAAPDRAAGDPVDTRTGGE